MKPETKIKVAINGFGRIGRNLFRLLLNHPNIEISAINDIADIKTMSHLLKYDSIHGVLPHEVSFDNQNLLVSNQKFPFYHENNISNLPWEALKLTLLLKRQENLKRMN